MAALAVAATLAGCGRDAGDLSRVAVIGDEPRLVETVTSPLSTSEAVVRSSLAQGLVRLDERGQVVPGLAESWNVSDDGLSYIFRLQTGEWPDGRKIRADEVARILNRQLRTASTNPLKDTLGAVTKILAMTDRVIEIRLSAPRPNLLQLLAQPELGLVRSSVGTGPFHIASPEEIASLSAEEREGGGMLIARRISIPDAEDPVEKVRITGGEAEKLIAAFTRGDLDLVLGGKVGDLPNAWEAKVPRGSRRFDPVGGLFGLVPTRSSELLQDAEVRRLLSRAVDRQALIDGLHVGGLQPRATVLQEGLDGISSVAQPSWLGEPAEDRRQLLSAPALRLFGTGERPVLRLFLPGGPGGDYLFARFRYDWEPLGLDLERATSASNADLVWIDEVAPSFSPAWFLRHFRCEAADICVEEADLLMDQAREASNPADRARLFLETAVMLDEAQVFIPIAAPIRWSLVSGRVPGFAENPFARHTLVGLRDPRLGGMP